MTKPLTFDHVFVHWLEAEVDKSEERDLAALAQKKGFNSIADWRLTTAKRLGMDNKEWRQIQIENPNEFLPGVLVGPFQGWSKFFDNQMDTSFAQALAITPFFDWCNRHNRIPLIAANFPTETSFIFYRKPDGKFIHIEGGHRICAVAYAQKIGQPVNFGPDTKVTAAVADITDDEIDNLKEFLKQGTSRS
jgi:hypothetical protein